VRELPDNPASAHVVRAVVNLARDFGHRTIAEGVEDDETLELLRELGVDFAQGYVIGRPAPLAETFGRSGSTSGAGVLLARARSDGEAGRPLARVRGPHDIVVRGLAHLAHDWFLRYLGLPARP